MFVFIDCSMEVSKNISSDSQQKKENLDNRDNRIKVKTQCIIRTPLFLRKKYFFLSFYDLGSCKSLEGDRWVVI